MTRPGDKVLQFARSQERGRKEVGGTVEGHGAERLKATMTSGELKQRSTGSWPSQDECIRMPLASGATISTSPADLSYSPRRRPNGTYQNGPEDRAGSVIKLIFVAALLVSGYLMCKYFFEAEEAIIRSLGGK